MRRLWFWAALAKVFGALLLLIAAYLQITVLSSYQSLRESWARYSVETRLELIWRAQSLASETERAKYIEENNGRFFSSGDKARKAQHEGDPAESMYLWWFVIGSILFCLGELLSAVEAYRNKDEKRS